MRNFLGTGVVIGFFCLLAGFLYIAPVFTASALAAVGWAKWSRDLTEFTVEEYLPRDYEGEPGLGLFLGCFIFLGFSTLVSSVLLMGYSLFWDNDTIDVIVGLLIVIYMVPALFSLVFDQSPKIFAKAVAVMR